MPREPHPRGANAPALALRLHPYPAAVGFALQELDIAGRVLVACSGGGDSLALLRACADLGEDTVAAYFDHRQRPDSLADGRHVAGLCRGWGVPFAAGAFVGPPGASEAALRAARYGWLGHAARRAGAAAILTGHTADDDAETVLMRLLRGTGVGGLAGIPESSRPPMTGGVTVARPMLRVTGRDARAFLADRGVAWREDPTNATPDYTRNRLRQRVIPRLVEVNPRWREAVLRLSGLAAEQSETLHALADELTARATAEWSESRIVLRTEDLPPVRSPARVEVLRSVWRRQRWPERRMGRDDWRRLGALHQSAVDLPHGVRAACDGATLTLTRRTDFGPAGSDGPAAD